MPYSARLKTAIASFILAACAHHPDVAPPPDNSPPNTDIYIADLSLASRMASVTGLKPLIASEGYDNQPAFLPGEDALLYTSAGRSGKTDLWRIDLASGKSTQITDTPDRSEYSPRLTPDSKAISFIQEPPAGDVTELYTRAIDNSTEGPFIALKPLGYYAILDKGQTVLTFLRDDPPTLQRVDRTTGAVTQIVSNIGRALYTGPDDQSAFFTAAREDGTYQLHRYDNAAGKTTPLFALKGTAQDYVVFKIPGDQALGFICAAGSALFFRTDSPRDTWQQMADLSASGVKEITRLSVNESATRLALVTGS